MHSATLILMLILALLMIIVGGATGVRAFFKYYLQFCHIIPKYCINCMGISGASNNKY